MAIRKRSNVRLSELLSALVGGEGCDRVVVDTEVAAPAGSAPGRNPFYKFAPNNIPSNVAASRVACLAARSCQYRSPVFPLYTPEEFLDSRAGRLPAINSPQAISLTVRHSGRGHRDLLPGNYGVADEWNRRRNSSMISRAHARGHTRDHMSILAPCVRFHPTGDICSDPREVRVGPKLFQFYVDLLLDNDRERERKRRALARLRLHPDCAPVQSR